MRKKTLTAVVGAQQSGKSKYTADAAAHFIAKKNTVVVYGWSGQPHDFEGYAAGNFLSTEEILKIDEKIKTQVNYNNGDLLYTVRTANGDYIKSPNGKAKIYNFKFVNLDFYARGLKFQATISHQHFFENVERYLSNALLVIDDAKPIVAYGLGDAGLNVVRRLNHAGSQHISKAYANKGIDCVFIFHSLLDLKESIYSSLNYIILFKTTEPPNVSDMQSPTGRAAVVDAYNKLIDMPKYSYIPITYCEPN